MRKRETNGGAWLLRRVGALIGGALLVISCAPSDVSTVSRDSAGPTSASPKTLVLGYPSFQAQLTSYGRLVGIGTNELERWLIFAGNLTTFDLQGNVVPLTAQKVPTIQDGDWRISPDGTMEVTWKIRPDAKWHDGVPLTAEDFAFGYEVVMTPALAVPELGEVANIASVRAADMQTVVVSWKTLSIYGNYNASEGVPVIPRHLLQDLYRSGDYPAFESSPVWASKHVGLGPYRVTEWEEGSHVEGEAFDQFVLGRPKIDRIVLRSIGDINVITANLLAGAIDVAPTATQLKPEQINELQRIWGDKGEAYTATNAVRGVFLQFIRPEAPWVRDLRFRQAMIYSMNREEWVEALQFGQTEFAHYLVMPDDPVIRLADQRGVIKYPFDPARAERLFAEAGWTRGPDRLLRNSAGESIPFRCCRQATGDSNDIRESLAVVDELKKAGFEATHPLPPAPAGLSSREARRYTTFEKEADIGPFRMHQRGGFMNMTSQFIRGDANGWAGANQGSWLNPTYDGLLAERMRTLDNSQRLEVDYQLVKLLAEELPVIPMYYNPIGLAVSNRVTGITRKPHAPRLIPVTTWNIHAWDIK